jgi:hypothetical protein
VKEGDSGRAEGAESLKDKGMKTKRGKRGVMPNLLSDQTGGGTEGRRREVKVRR